MSKKSESVGFLEADPASSPFREFRDNELLPEYWGLGPMAMRPVLGKVVGRKEAVPKGEKGEKDKKIKGEHEEFPEVVLWEDPQVQPLPRSARRHLSGWRAPEELAAERWNISEVVIFEEPHLLGGKLEVQEVQIAHAQVLLRSSFCRNVMSCCYVLENADNMLVEHQSEHFMFTLGPEGWRARYHIYSPLVKPGGHIHHRPTLNKNGCYLVRLFYMGCWRCVWVSDQVPVDANDAPLLPFSPITPVIKTKTTSGPPCVQLWPLLLCKALLKLAAPDMESDDLDLVEDESMEYFSIMHALTGATVMPFYALSTEDVTWVHLLKEVPVFHWDDDDQTMTTGTGKTKSTKKTNKEPSSIRVSGKKGSPGFALTQRGTITTVTLRDTRTLPAYYLPGICPAHRMTLSMGMMRDLPLKKPLPEPVSLLRTEVPMWKTFRWVEWARKHGLYDAYACPRTRFVKLQGLLKLSYAPHLLDVMSGDSCFSPPETTVPARGSKYQESTKTVITYNFRMEHAVAPPPATGTTTATSKKQKKEVQTAANQVPQISREEFREWVLYDPMYEVAESVHFVYFPSSYNHASAFKTPPSRPDDLKGKSTRATFVQAIKQTDQRAPGNAPLYLQVDNPTPMRLKVDLETIHPNVLLHSKIPHRDCLMKGYVVLEEFEWFEDCEVPYPKGFIETRGYDAIEVTLVPGRHFLRLWVSCPLNWHASVLSDAAVLMGGRDVVLAAANAECPWVANVLTEIGAAFIGWVRNTKTDKPEKPEKNADKTVTIAQSLSAEREFIESYQPDLPWDKEIAGYPKKYIHWMFKKALQKILKRELPPVEYPVACQVFSRYFRDPDFGFSEKAPVQRPFREIAMIDPCDCVIPEYEEEFLSNTAEEDQTSPDEIRLPPGPRVSIKVSSGIDSKTVLKLLEPPEPPAQSQICDAAKEPLTCPMLKIERAKIIQKHEAATLLQACWRGYLARKCMKSTAVFTPEILKSVMECTFGNLESLSHLMNELFRSFPGIKHAFSISSGLNGGNMLVQNTSVAKVAVGSRWLPFFQGTYYAHMPVKVHFDLTSNIKHTTFAVYDNDTQEQVPQAYNTHKTFHFAPNRLGYAVLGHGTLHHSAMTTSDAIWTLTVLSSTANVFHICDNEFYCRVGAISTSEKFHTEELYMPNRRNILGGVVLTVTKLDTASFRAACTNPELELEATLWHIEKDGPPREVAHCRGVGELYWPYIRLEPAESAWTGRVVQSRIGNATASARSIRAKSKQSTTNLRVHTKSSTRLHKEAKEVRTYIIEVTAPKGWPLTIEQWKRVDQVRNSTSFDEHKKDKISPPRKKDEKKPPTAREKEKGDSWSKFTIFNYSLQPGDAYAEIECATARNGGIVAKKDDTRDMALYTAIKSWDYPSILVHDDPKATRGSMGASYRKLFREENLEYSPLHPDESVLLVSGGPGTVESYIEEIERSCTLTQFSGEFMESHEEETKYLSMPALLKDRFHELYFVPLVMKELGDECALQTPDRAQAAQAERQARQLAAAARTEELDSYNEEVVIGGQRRRGRLVETLYVDSLLRPEIIDAYNERDEIIAKEIIQILAVTRGGKPVKEDTKKKGKKGKAKA